MMASPVLSSHRMFPVLTVFSSFPDAWSTASLQTLSHHATLTVLVKHTSHLRVARSEEQLLVHFEFDPSTLPGMVDCSFFLEKLSSLGAYVGEPIPQFSSYLTPFLIPHFLPDF